MTWGISGSGSTDPAKLPDIEAIFNEAAEKAKALCPDSFTCSYWDDRGSKVLPVAAPE